MISLVHYFTTHLPLVMAFSASVLGRRRLYTIHYDRQQGLPTATAMLLLLSTNARIIISTKAKLQTEDATGNSPYIPSVSITCDCTTRVVIDIFQKYRRYSISMPALKVSISRSILQYRYFYSDHTVATSVDGREPWDYGVRKHSLTAMSHTS